MTKIALAGIVCVLVTGCAPPSDKDMAEIARRNKAIILYDEVGNRYSATYSNQGGDLWILLRANEEK